MKDHCHGVDQNYCYPHIGKEWMGVLPVGHPAGHPALIYTYIWIKTPSQSRVKNFAKNWCKIEKSLKFGFKNFQIFWKKISFIPVEVSEGFWPSRRCLTYSTPRVVSLFFSHHLQMIHLPSNDKVAYYARSRF